MYYKQYLCILYINSKNKSKRAIVNCVLYIILFICRRARARGSMVGKLCVFFIWGYWHLPISSWSTDFITHCCRYLLFMMVTQQQHLTSQYFSAPCVGIVRGCHCAAHVWWLTHVTLGIFSQLQSFTIDSLLTATVSSFAFSLNKTIKHGI